MRQPFAPLARIVLRTALALAILFSVSAMTAQTTAADPLSGVWGAEVRFGMPVEGDLTVHGRGPAWSASIDGLSAPVTASGNDLRFALANHLGEFRGVRDASTNTIRGEWIQPGGVILDPQYASPITLHAIARSVWRGTVVPLDQRISVYVSISSRDGKTTATISNPEGNFFRDGAKVTLQANGKKIEGTWDEKSGMLSLQIVDWLPIFQFTRRTTEDAIGFYPRSASDTAAWIYRSPLPGDDGWATASMQAEGLNSAPIEELVHRILAADPESTALKIQSLLIARHGHLVLEEYFYGFAQDRVHDTRSAGKTFAPVLAGLAMERGAKLTPQTPVYPLFSQYSSFANPDPRKQKMVLRDIMTMTAGNACDDNNDDSPGNEDTIQGDSTQKDWYKHSLDLPMLKNPGGDDAVYCSADLNLVGGAVAAATHRWLPEFFDDALARPLQFDRYYLNLMPDGQAYMGGGAYLRPRDQLKLGQLYLDGGLWNGKRILSKDWVTESTSVHSHFDPKYSLGRTHEYGYGWHIHQLKSGEKTYKVFAAEGNGGQFVIVIPELDLVVGITGGSYGEFNQWYRWDLELVPQFIIPAAVSVPTR
jgi:CubicO group peptidase (beta-lactamase class C family)